MSLVKLLGYSRSLKIKAGVK
jgi:hypothetical protein